MPPLARSFFLFISPLYHLGEIMVDATHAAAFPPVGGVIPSACRKGGEISDIPSSGGAPAACTTAVLHGITQLPLSLFQIFPHSGFGLMQPVLHLYLTATALFISSERTTSWIRKTFRRSVRQEDGGARKAQQPTPDSEAAQQGTNDKGPDGVHTSAGRTYGLLGLLSVIRNENPDRSSLALGKDPDLLLGLNLNSSTSLYEKFTSPWDESSEGAAFSSSPLNLPCYPSTVLRKKPEHFSHFARETLFYVFTRCRGTNFRVPPRWNFTNEDGNTTKK